MKSMTRDDHRHPIARHETLDRFAGGIVLATLGLLTLLVSGGEPGQPASEYNAERPAASAGTEDWHGNVRRSHWAP